jgi:hypothetical protein
VRIGHFTPAYRSTVHVEHSFSTLRDFAWCVENGHEMVPFYVAGFSVERARNFALRQAINFDCDLLLMCDADVFAESALASLVRTWETNGRHALLAPLDVRERPAVVGAAVPTRRRGVMNCEPYQPGKICEGVVGTGLMLIDVKQVKKLSAPWFRVELSGDGTEVACGEDIYFCRRVREAGMRVLVDATIPTRHVDETTLAA